jgi:hypothetical protein
MTGGVERCSVEIAALVLDRTKLAISKAMPLSIFSIAPTSGRDDPRRMGERFHGEIIVRAHSAQDAREVAAADMPLDAHLIERDDLYRVVEVNYGDAFRNAGPRGVIARFKYS